MFLRVAAVFVLIALSATPASAQFGIGGHISTVRAEDDGDGESQRFTGGHIRALLSPRTGIEVSLERRTDTNEEETLRVRQYPLQASLLLFPVRSAFAPYVLGGGGWYTTRVEVLDGETTVSSESTRKFGWHGGFGAELRFGRRMSAHADYRYTHLSFGDDEEEESGLLQFLPSHKGSMWTAGFTVYF